ncbi:hypothetical protein GCM10010211_82890 [Streptomyces albospinus]|uniref:Uncharacterized protein n=1 Tax=Streptomyces albospinus TaxID=285515 RepID=A0ABQ2VP56_9ACTN|nr:hypothetical protein GCM10010211_82890 [Streptomyces albospinus]
MAGVEGVDGARDPVVGGALEGARQPGTGQQGARNGELTYGRGGGRPDVGALAGVAALVAVWGSAYGGVSVRTQTWLMGARRASGRPPPRCSWRCSSGAVALGAPAGGRAADGWAPPA